MLLPLLLTTAFLHSAAAPTEYRVLLVGLGPYATKDPNLRTLHGETDVKTFHSALNTYYNVPDSSIHEILGAAATKAKIESEFKDWLVNGAGPNRAMIFFYSGHGTITHDLSQKLCSALIPIDVKRLTPGGAFDSSTLITRDFFNSELKELRDPKINATNI